MKLFLSFVSCLLWLASLSQTTACFINGDTLFAGSTDNSRIINDGKFYYVFDGPFDSKFINTIDKIAAASSHFKSFSDSCASKLRRILADTFTALYHKDPGYFDRQIMGNSSSIGVARVVLFGHEHSKPDMVEIVFTMNKGVKHPVVITAGTDETPLSFISSNHQPPNAKLAVLWRGETGLLVIKRLIYNRASGSTVETGPPLDILILTKQGKKWVRK